MKLILKKPDNIGILASSLCAIHCIATPFLFIAHSCCAISGTSMAPDWWRSIDFLFLVVSFFAVYHSGKTTSKKFMKFLLWGTWALLFIAIINENIRLITLPSGSVYFLGFGLAIVHLYNRNYCQCKTVKCCSNK